MLRSSHANGLGRRTANQMQASGARAFSARPINRAQLVVRANWGAPVEFSDAKVVSNKQLFPGMHQIQVDVGSKIASGYTKPGQYVQAKVAADGKAGFFAIASAPASSPTTVELLIKSAPGSTAEAITGLAQGGALMVSPAQGKGFPLDKIPVSEVDTVLMFATGSGISPLKAVIESGSLGERKHIELFYGTKCKDTTAYHDLFEDWTNNSRVSVTHVMSGSNKRYVQTALEEALKGGLLPAGSASRVGVLLCGHKDMCNAVTALLTEHGVSKDRILLNF